MDASAPQWLGALEASGLGLSIRQSVWVYPAANVGHVVAVIAFFAAVAVMDLALLGIIDARRRHVLVSGARRAAVVLLSCVLLTGTVLFVAEASHVALNRVFQIKLALIAIAGLNAVLLGRRAIAVAHLAADHAPLPGYAHVAAGFSLFLWLLVAALGRYIAYH